MNIPLGLAQAYADAAREVVRTRVAVTSLDTEQHIAHGLAWIETAVEALRALHAWGERHSSAPPISDWPLMSLPC